MPAEGESRSLISGTLLAALCNSSRLPAPGFASNWGSSARRFPGSGNRLSSAILGSRSTHSTVGFIYCIELWKHGQDGQLAVKVCLLMFGVGLWAGGGAGQ